MKREGYQNSLLILRIACKSCTIGYFSLNQIYQYDQCFAQQEF